MTLCHRPINLQHKLSGADMLVEHYDKCYMNLFYSFSRDNNDVLLSSNDHITPAVPSKGGSVGKGDRLPSFHFISQFRFQDP